MRRNRFEILIFIILITPLIANQAEDWRGNIDRFFGSVPNPEGLSAFLAPVYFQASAEDRPLISLILAFAASRVENRSQEEYWLNQFFQILGEPSLQINCFRDSINIDLTEYLSRWRRQYPRTRSISLPQNRYPFTEKPSSLLLNIDIPVSCSYRLKNKEKVIETGSLSPGFNAIMLPVLNYESSNPLPPLTLELESAGIVIRKSIGVELTYEKPEEAEIQDQVITLKGRSFRNANKIIFETNQQRKFNKKRLFSRFLPFLGAGIALFVVNRLAIHPGSRPWNRAAEGCLTAASIGFSLKSIQYLFDSFPEESQKKPVSVVDEEAVRYNEQLKQAIEKMKKSVFTVFSIQVKEIES